MAACLLSWYPAAFEFRTNLLGAYKLTDDHSSPGKASLIVKRRSVFRSHFTIVHLNGLLGRMGALLGRAVRIANLVAGCAHGQSVVVEAGLLVAVGALRRGRP